MATPSTQMITDATSLVGNFNAASYTKALAATGPIQDLDGNMRLVILKLNEAKILLGQIRNGVDAAGADSASADVIDNLLASLD